MYPQQTEWLLTLCCQLEFKSRISPNTLKGANCESNKLWIEDAQWGEEIKSVILMARVNSSHLRAAQTVRIHAFHLTPFWFLRNCHLVMWGAVILLITRCYSHNNKHNPINYSREAQETLTLLNITTKAIIIHPLLFLATCQNDVSRGWFLQSWLLGNSLITLLWHSWHWVSARHHQHPLTMWPYPQETTIPLTLLYVLFSKSV